MTSNQRWILVATLMVVFAISGAWYYQTHQTLTMTLQFNPVIGSQPLELNELRYKNPGGEGVFKIRDFQFFISNIRFTTAEGEYVEPDSYHLARFDNSLGAYAVRLKEVPRQAYQNIQFGIGVDEAANNSIDPIGDLDPNSRMAWSWDVGYKFVLMEGGLSHGDVFVPLVYHVGFSENYKTLKFDVSQSVIDGSDVSFNFQVDVMTMFNGVEPIDMATTSNVKFDRTDARMLANNYAEMISLID